MCGRFTYRYTWKQLHALLNLSSPRATLHGVFDPAEGVFGARFNVAPTQMAPVVRQAPDGAALSVDAIKWGLQPPWLDKAGPINARAETVVTQPMFRSAFKSRRCVVPVSGFYEWQAGEVGQAKAKQPWYIYRADGQPLLFAGLWEARDGLETFHRHDHAQRVHSQAAQPHAGDPRARAGAAMAGKPRALAAGARRRRGAHGPQGEHEG